MPQRERLDRIEALDVVLVEDQTCIGLQGLSNAFSGAFLPHAHLPCDTDEQLLLRTENGKGAGSRARSHGRSKWRTALRAVSCSVGRRGA